MSSAFFSSALGAGAGVWAVAKPAVPKAKAMPITNAMIFFMWFHLLSLLSRICSKRTLVCAYLDTLTPAVMSRFMWPIEPGGFRVDPLLAPVVQGFKLLSMPFHDRSRNLGFMLLGLVALGYPQAAGAEPEGLPLQNRATESLPVRPAGPSPG